MAVNSKFVLGWHGTYCRMQVIGLGFVVKYTYAQGQVTKSEDMPRPDARGRGRGRGQHVEVEAEDKISASRTVWHRGLNITEACCTTNPQQIGVMESDSYRATSEEKTTCRERAYIYVAEMYSCLLGACATVNSPYRYRRRGAVGSDSAWKRRPHRLRTLPPDRPTGGESARTEASGAGNVDPPQKGWSVVNSPQRRRI